MPAPAQSLEYNVEYPEKLSRWLGFAKWLLAIPHLLILLGLTVAAVFAAIAAAVAITATGRYPPPLFNFIAGANRWAANVTAYVALQRDEYPPFSLNDREYPVQYQVAYPEHPNRWIAVLKPVLLIPHLVAFVIASTLAVFAALWALGVIVVKGRYPSDIFGFFVELGRWRADIAEYASSLRDVYPAFPRWVVPWIWLAPAFVLLGVFLVYPSIDTIRRSFMDERSADWVWFDNYEFIIRNPQPLVADTHSALVNNVLWMTVFTFFTVAIGLIIAVLAARVRYEAFAKATIFIPMAISFVALSVIWRFMYEFNPDIGTVNAVTTQLGVEPTAWLQNDGSPQTVFTDAGPDELPQPFQINNFALIIVGIWNWTGFTMIVLSAGLKGISTDVMEAARVDGANELQIFRRIILPILSPTIVVVSTTLVIQTLKTFDLIWVMTGGRFSTDVVATLFFRQAFVVGDFGVGAALAVVLMLFVVPIMLVTIRRFQFQEEIR